MPYFGHPSFALSQGRPGSDFAGTSEVVVAYLASPTSAEDGGWGGLPERKEKERESVLLWDLKREPINF